MSNFTVFLYFVPNILARIVGSREKQAYTSETWSILMILGCLSKCSCQGALWLMRRDFEYSCDQATFRIPLSKKKLPEQWRELFLPKCPFLTLVLNKNNNSKHAEYHVIFIPFKDKIYSKQVSQISVLFEKWTLVSFPPMFGWSQSSTVNSDLTNFVDVQLLQENIKWISLYISNEIYPYFIYKNIVVPHFFIKTFHF